jgi:Mor family transcriptional regulator
MLEAKAYWKGQESLQHEQLDEIASIIGNENTLKLVDAVKYRHIYIPKKKLTPDSLIVKALGKLWASILQDHFAGDTIQLSGVWKYRRNKRNERILQDYLRGKKPKRLSAEYGIHIVHIHRIIKAMRRSPKTKVIPYQKAEEGGRGSFYTNGLRVGSTRQDSDSFQNH